MYLSFIAVRIYRLEFPRNHSVVIHLLLVMYTVLSFEVSLSHFYMMGYTVPVKQSRELVMLQTRAGGLWRCPSEGMAGQENEELEFAAY